MKRKQLKSIGIFALAIAMVLSCFSVALAVQSDAAMSYEAYFSQDRDFELPTTIDALDDYYVFIAGPDAYTDCTGLTEGALYKRSWTDGSTELLVEAPVVAVRFCEDRIYYSNGINIISINVDGADRKAVFTDEDGIGFFTPSADVIFYEQGNRLMRLYRTSGRVDDVCSLEHIVWYQPLTNNSIEVSTDGTLCPEKEQDMSDSDKLIYHLSTKSFDVVPDTSLDISLFTSQVNKTYTINGVKVPILIPKISEKDLNGNGIKDDIDPGKYLDGTTRFVSPNKYFTLNPSLTYNEASNKSMRFDGASQCAGFALYVYYEIWGSTSAGHHHTYSASGSSANNNNLTETSAKAFYKALTPGARIRGGTDLVGHSFIFLGTTSTGIVIYDANRTKDPTCLVQMTEFTFGEAAAHNRIGNIHNFWMPPHNAGSAGHYVCADSSCTSVAGGGGLQNHYTLNGPGYGTCVVCGYTGYISDSIQSVGGGEVECK